MQNILAALREGIQADKESIGADFPLVLAAGLVLKVGIFEFGADFEGLTKFLVSLERLFILDAFKDFLAIDIAAALSDDGIANLAD